MELDAKNNLLWIPKPRWSRAELPMDEITHEFAYVSLVCIGKPVCCIAR